ncbi:alpha-ketoglutarate-dependent dioxygenase AlkB [Candidatus Deianiraea vastatrix]|uniref:Alkylated DNA repair protein AlkB n=1 Tax=Candidatus Deianiraea vastatrix TaxID=2163644 RepID=A0A5B8XDG5_9RICK|nr:alpha-ketoglutarate-dependent dioxygenase AlkB [Candidatus Deianiraea vastatrix]QED23056.1 Alkylated DNA repair protein AlkB [Candidatus Deianiraea vastatrix]
MTLFASEIPNIEGLSYATNYITLEQEQFLIDRIDKQPWLSDLKRRVQHYGYKYDYKARRITPDLKIADVPAWLQILPSFDQVIINEYRAGQGITPHIDCIPCFGDTICIVSLLEDCEMILENAGVKHSIILHQKSLLKLEGEARYKWKHSIPQRKSNINNRRVSITYRKVIL